MTANEQLASVGRNIQEKATLIWNVANTLFGAFKPHEYGLVILPMVVVKRFHDCLLPTHQAVLNTCKKVEHLAVKEGFLRTAAGYQFYNTSPFTFETLRADPENINDNFRAYLNGFSDNVQDILARMNFNAQIDRMEEAGLLYQVIVDFCSDKADMKPEKISAVDMGYIFENLVQRFSESYNEEAGAHFTSRDIIYLMCDLLVTGDQNTFHGEGITKTVYDMTMGTSQMLTCMEERLKQLDADADGTCFGQELNPFTFGIAKADMLIRGGDPDNMQFGDTLDDDKFDGYQFDYCISNPPFGIDWKREATAVEAEHTEMKDSGIEWLGRIPNDWCTIRVKYAFRIKKEIAGELGHTVLSVTQRGIKPKDMSEKGQFSLDYHIVSQSDISWFLLRCCGAQVGSHRSRRWQHLCLENPAP